MNIKKFGWIILVGASLMTGCGNSMPKEVIPPAKMEKVLYDYHLALGLSGQLPASENYKKQAYKNYLFKKHQITEAQFDSSMVWYTRNSYELSKIYQNLDKRFSREKTKLTSMLQERHIDIATQAGDTVNIWHYYPVYWLTDAPLNNKFTFTMRADSNFWIKDAFAWNADLTYLDAGKLTMGLNIRYENDSVTGKTIAMTQSGRHSLYIQSDSLNKIKDINGFIYVDKDSVHQTPNVLISNVSLIKYHKSKDKLTSESEIKDLKEEEIPEPRRVKRTKTRLTKQAPKN